MDIQTEWVTIDVNGSPMKAYLAKPTSGGPHPGVVVFMEIFGINEHIQDVTRRIAAEGYVAIAPNFYHRQAADLNLGYTPEAIEEGRKYKMEVSHKGLLADARATIAYLQGLATCASQDKLASIGFCFGGYVAYVVATLPEIAVTASFYGTGLPHQTAGKEEAPTDLTSQIKGYVFCGFGEQDSSIPPADIQAVKQALAKAHVPHKIIVYPGADHGFFCDRRASYNPQAALEAWQEIKHLFALHLKGATV